MIIKGKEWNALNANEKFNLLLEHSNLNVLGAQVIKGNKNKPHDQGNLA